MARVLEWVAMPFSKCIGWGVITDTLGFSTGLQWGFPATLDLTAAHFICTGSSIVIEVTIFYLWTWRRKSMFHIDFVWIMNLRNQVKPKKSALSSISFFCLLSWRMHKHLKCFYPFPILLKLKAVNKKEYCISAFISISCIRVPIGIKKKKT